LELIPRFEWRKDASLPTVLAEKVRGFNSNRLIPLMPALAIPATGKSDFICPNDHLESLDEVIPQVAKILIVGWKAGEQHFLKRLAKGLGEKNVKVLAVRGGIDGAKETLLTLESAGIRGDFQADPGGFSDFVLSNRAEPFLVG
jgi:hypothetical protein